MARYRVPFAETSPDEEPEGLDPGPVLARVVDEGLLQGEGKGTVEGSLDTPWGKLEAERRGEDEVLLALPEAEVTSRQVMLNVAAMKLGVDKQTVEASEGTIQEIDVGERVLVVPFDTPEALEQAPSELDPSGVPGVQAEAAVGYAVTQTSPYVRIQARSWGLAPMTALAAAAMHLVQSEGFRPTYPRTRVVGRLLGGEEECEVTVQAREAGAGPVVERVLVGGHVERLEG